jgi:hypothetical protein
MHLHGSEECHRHSPHVQMAKYLEVLQYQNTQTVFAPVHASPVLLSLNSHAPKLSTLPNSCTSRCWQSCCFSTPLPSTPPSTQPDPQCCQQGSQHSLPPLATGSCTQLETVVTFC